MSALPRATVRAGVFDVVAVLVFVALGRRSHDEGGNAVTETLRVGAPFLIALAVGWLVARAWTRPVALTTGVIVWVVTVVAGMVLRNIVFDRGTATSFVLVATIATGVLLVGWRAVALAISRRH